MAADLQALAAHLALGTTTVCRCWGVTRRDGVQLGFTDHDRDLRFDGVTFLAASGMTATALQQGSGLAVDNSQAAGILSAAAVTEADIMAGLYDGATVDIWQVNWADTSARRRLFRGALGEIRRSDGAFEAELRGLAEILNQPTGMIYHHDCAAVLGDARCRFDLTSPGFAVDLTVGTVADDRVFLFADLADFSAQWFENGALRVQSGAAAGLVGVIKSDQMRESGERRIELWQALRGAISAGDRVRIEPGCDKRAETCREKFGNFHNFRGFPHIPGDDWLTSYPAGSSPDDGGSMNR
jgi:uncharacterized phage protein (TIGR02218 family)